MGYCCDEMEHQLRHECEGHRDLSDCPDSLIERRSESNWFGIRVHDGGSSGIEISYCPWCGSRLSSVGDAERDPVEQDANSYYFRFSASIRIFGDDLDLDAITTTTGLTPTHTHKKGTAGTLRAWTSDAWIFSPPVDETQPLEQHIMALWAAIRPSTGYLRKLKQEHQVDVFCGYRSNCDHAGLEVGHECLGLFAELETPFGISVIVA